MVCTDAIVYVVILFSGCIFVICVICRTTSHHPMNMIITRFCMKLYRRMSRTWSSHMKLTRHGVMLCCQMCRRCLLSGKCASKPLVCINDYQTANVVRGRQEGHPACKNWVVRYWHGYLYGARIKWFAYGPADATVTPSSLAAVKSRMAYLFGAGLPRLTWKNVR